MQLNIISGKARFYPENEITVSLASMIVKRLI
jgi:hypothetical protein